MAKISIITPFYNGSRYIEQCVRGVQAQILKDVEHIIINDGSTASEREFIVKLSKNLSGVTLITTKNMGQASAVNVGIRVASGEYIAFCDQDDWWLPAKLQKQLAYLESHLDIDMVYTDAYLGDDAGNILKTTWMQSRRVIPRIGGYDDCIAQIFEKNFICAPLVILVRKKIFYQVGVMDDVLRSAYDYDFLFRYLEGGYKLGFIGEPLAIWRIHEGQESKNIRKAKLSQARILGRFLTRRPGFIVDHPWIVMKKFVYTTVGWVSNKISKVG